MIRYGDVITDSIVDGPGIRVVTFLQGCPRRCEGCHNPSLLPREGGQEITERELAKMLLKKLTPKHAGLTFSGGDPLMQWEKLLNVISFIRKRKPGVNIWVYTGYTFEEVKDLPVMELIDVLVDGPFIIKEKDISLVFRGSRNQRIIDVSKSLESGEIREFFLEKNVVNS
ncbi:MAG: anaerobic ribonucleoside-triphosphate reductase activating protein [Clostridia bacterium]|jgi:anaerobic ribonucleoside-triphosphate reductase activating protein|nr:anaerobic ribonucleoside-triphosphate reductase activating protein [Clostridia bacterium]MDN5323786.1 anaerobic ribonucleoside-triphosphate reductase activating protein [Clostridia bacterium]